MKRFLVLAAAALLLFVATASFAEGGKEQKVVVNWATVWVRGEMGPNTYPLDLVDKYAKAHPNVELKIDATSHDPYFTVKYKSMVAADALPELFHVNSSDMLSSFKAGRLMNWTPVLDSAWKNQFLDMWTETTFDGKVWAIPYQFITNEAFYYNAEILKKAGYNSFPTVWEDMLVMFEKLKGMGYMPITMGDKGGWPMWSHFGEILCEYLMGPEWVKEIGAYSGKRAYTDAGFVTVMKMIDELWKKGYFNKDILAIDHGTEDLAYFFSGKAATTPIGSWGVSQMVTNAPKEMMDSIMVAPIPRPAASKPEVKTGMFTGGSGWELSGNTKMSDAQKKVVVDIVKILTGPEYSKYVVEAGAIPVLKMEYVTGWDANKVPRLQQDMNKLISASPRIPLMNQEQSGPEMTDVLYKACQDMIAGTLTPEQAVVKIQETFARVVAKMKQ
jgi:raffinose/stachyose/melibiose transport system substrate-binding protein